MYDPAPEYRYSEVPRRHIATILEEKEGIPIDTPVTTDESRVIRLPYSLHAGVSRVVTPIESPDFDYRSDAVPAFLSEPEVTQ
jgi:DNA primase catalytic subunit